MKKKKLFNSLSFVLFSFAKVTKLFGVNYDTPTANVQIHTSASQLSAPGSYMLAPSYSEALLMDPLPDSRRNQRTVQMEEEEEGSMPLLQRPLSSDSGLVMSAIGYDPEELFCQRRPSVDNRVDYRMGLMLDLEALSTYRLIDGCPRNSNSNETACECSCHKIEDNADESEDIHNRNSGTAEAQKVCLIDYLTQNNVTYVLTTNFESGFFITRTLYIQKKKFCMMFEPFLNRTTQFFWGFLIFCV